MHILHIIDSLEFGGAEKVVVHLANKMLQQHKISICLIKRTGELLNELESEITVYSMQLGEGNYFSSIPRLAEIIKDAQVDVIHIHNWGCFLVSVLAARKAQCKKIFHTVHGPYLNYPEGIVSSIKKYLRHSLERFLSKKISKHISVSDDIRRYMIEDVGIKGKNIITIHNGIKGLEAVINENKEVNDITKLVIVGRVAEIKNHKLLLRSLKKTIKNVAVELTIVGDGPELENIKALSETLGISDSVHFLGFRNDIHDILKQMDVLIVSSKYEGVSIAILEAMSMAIPVIATRVGGNPETIIDNKTGFLVEQNEVSMAEAIVEMARSPDLRKKMGLSGVEHFNQYFSEEKVIDAILKLYKGGSVEQRKS